MKMGTIKRAAALGALSGMRSMAGIAVLSKRLGRKRAHHRGARILRQTALLRVLPVLRIGEIIVDKLPLLPNRTAPLPLAARALMGGLVGGILASEERGPVWLATGVGALAAIAAAHLAFRARKYAHERRSIPDAVLASVEDGMVLGIGAFVR